jgi:HrpA-like RNA helicase
MFALFLHSVYLHAPSLYFPFCILSECDCLEEVTTICAMLSAESIWVTPPPPSRENRFAAAAKSAAPQAESRLQMNFKGSYGQSQHAHHNNSSNYNNNSSEESERARRAHAALSHPYGDFHTYLHVYNSWESNNRSVQWCERNFVNFRSMKTVASIRYVATGFQIDYIYDSLTRHPFVCFIYLFLYLYI